MHLKKVCNIKLRNGLKSILLMCRQMAEPQRTDVESVYEEERRKELESHDEGGSASGTGSRDRTPSSPGTEREAANTGEARQSSHRKGGQFWAIVSSN
jgi:hypothetical protein